LTNINQIKNAEKMGSRFVPELESVRGIAAVSVAITHGLIALNYANTDAVWLMPPWAATGYELAWVTSLLVLFNGAAAVTVFFVLSGIVLGMALESRHEQFTVIWRDFIVARIARIYPSVFVATGFIVVYLRYFHHDQLFSAASRWYGWWYHSALSPEMVFKNLLLIDQTMNPIAWTLAVEVMVALLFPPMFKLSRRLSISVNAVVVLFLMVLAYAVPDRLLCAHLYKFYLGMLLPRVAGAVWMRRLYQPVPLMLAALLMLAARSVWGFGQPLSGMAETLGAGLLMSALCAGNPLHPSVRHLLRGSWVRWAGRVSYSFYLWNFIVLYILTHVLLQFVPPAQIQAHTLACGLGLAGVSIVLTGMWASLMYRLVERKGMMLGKRLITLMRKFTA